MVWCVLSVLCAGSAITFQIKDRRNVPLVEPICLSVVSLRGGRMKIKIYKFERSKIPVGKWEIEVDDSEVVNLISKLVRMLYEGDR